MNLMDRYRALTQGREQDAYKRRIAAFGLPAILAPYGGGYLPSRLGEVERAAAEASAAVESLPRQRRGQ